MKEADCTQLVDWIDDVIMHHDNDTIIKEVSKKINSFMEQFPLYEDALVTSD